MKTILAYSDSLTFGANPTGGTRQAYADRWPSALETGLIGKARVVAEDLGGRATASDDWYATADRNGVRILPTLLESHDPHGVHLDAKNTRAIGTGLVPVVISMLGP
ncbi:MAG: hypothetical protein MO846_00665 [Candidatus Devosia symbiotica]|nr:hypothetical protein [Candidatus Devosia symbiotica]